MAMTQNQYIELEANIQKHWDSVHKSERDYRTQLYNMKKSNISRELHQGFGTFGQMSPWSGAVNYDRLKLGHENEYRHGKYSTGVQVERELIDFKNYNEIASRVKNVSYGVHKTLQSHGVSVLENAFNPAFTGPDGQPLCSNAHLIIPGADPQSNLGNLDFSVENLNTTRVRMRQFVDDRGDNMDVQGDFVICGVELEKEVAQCLGSDKEAFTAENQKNFYSNMTYLVHPLITGRKWFLSSKQLIKSGKGLNWYTARDPRKLERDSDFDTEVLKWKAVGLWSYGWDDFYFIYGNNPA